MIGGQERENVGHVTIGTDFFVLKIPLIFVFYEDTRWYHDWAAIQ